MTLKAHYNAPLARVFRQFRNGLIYFTVGLMIIYLAKTTLSSSLKQEIIVLAGLAMAAIGFLMAMLAHIRLVIGRIYQAMSHKRDK